MMSIPDPQPHVFTLTPQELAILQTTHYLALTRASDWVASLQSPDARTLRTNVEAAEIAERDLRILGFMIGETFDKNLPLAQLYISNVSLGALLAIWVRAKGPYPEAYWRSGEDDEIPAGFVRFTREDVADLQRRFREVYVK